jgi:hypothetical protein
VSCLFYSKQEEIRSVHPSVYFISRSDPLISMKFGVGKFNFELNHSNKTHVLQFQSSGFCRHDPSCSQRIFIVEVYISLSTQSRNFWIHPHSVRELVLCMDVKLGLSH